MSNRAEHTPGPWIFCGYNNAVLEEKRSIDGCSETICEMGQCAKIKGPSMDHAHTNARLIAAAPELLAALETALAWIEYRNEDDGGQGILPCVAIARAAIKKARGES